MECWEIGGAIRIATAFQNGGTRDWIDRKITERSERGGNEELNDQQLELNYQSMEIKCNGEQGRAMQYLMYSIWAEGKLSETS